MATKLFLRSTVPVEDVFPYQNMIIVPGLDYNDGGLLSAITDFPETQVELQPLTPFNGQTGWVSGRVPSGGFTLTTATLSVWGNEQDAATNSSIRARIYKLAANGTITELGGGPFDNATEFSSTDFLERTVTCNVTDTAFAEDDRILLRLFIIPVGGVWVDGKTAYIAYNDVDGGFSSYLNIAETVTFKAEPSTDDRLHLREYLQNGNGSFLAMTDGPLYIGGSEDVINTTLLGTEIVFTPDAKVGWKSDLTPPGGFTLSTITINLWAKQSSALANAGLRVRLYKKLEVSPFTETEIAGGPFDDTVELGTTISLRSIVCNTTATVFNEGETLVLKVSAIPLGGVWTAVDTVTLFYGGTNEYNSYAKLGTFVSFGIVSRNVAGPGNDTLIGLALVNGPDQLISIDSGTGAGTLLAHCSAQMSGLGLGYGDFSIWTYDTINNKIVEINWANGGIVDSYSSGLTIAGEGGLEYIVGGTGYIIAGSGSTGKLYSFNVSAETVTYIANTLVSATPINFDGIAYSGGILYGLSQESTPKLYTINVSTGACTLIGSTGITGASRGGLAFASTGVLYAIILDDLYSINISTGVGTAEGSIGSFFLYGLAGGSVENLARTPDFIVINFDGIDVLTKRTPAYIIVQFNLFIPGHLGVMSVAPHVLQIHFAFRNQSLSGTSAGIEITPTPIIIKTQLLDTNSQSTVGIFITPEPIVISFNSERSPVSRGPYPGPISYVNAGNIMIGSCRDGKGEDFTAELAIGTADQGSGCLVSNGGQFLCIYSRENICYYKKTDNPETWADSSEITIPTATGPISGACEYRKGQVFLLANKIGYISRDFGITWETGPDLQSLIPGISGVTAFHDYVIIVYTKDGTLHHLISEDGGLSFV